MNKERVPMNANLRPKYLPREGSKTRSHKSESCRMDSCHSISASVVVYESPESENADESAALNVSSGSAPRLGMSSGRASALLSGCNGASISSSIKESSVGQQLHPFSPRCMREHRQSVWMDVGDARVEDKNKGTCLGARIQTNKKIGGRKNMATK
jgi:hypothetical protein